MADQSSKGSKVVTASTATTPAKRQADPISAPLTLRDDALARTFFHVQPVLLLGYFLARFSALVDDPVHALLRDLLPLTLLQTVYCTLCLPAAGSVPSSDAASSATKRRTRSRPGTKASPHGPSADSVGHRFTTALLSLSATLVAGTGVLFVLAVLFGAPITTHQAHTTLLAAHTAVLAALPLFYTRGLDRDSWWDVACLQLPLDAIGGMALGSVIGGYLGAIPIPLDWDRDWQKWPITIVTGVYIGSIVGTLAGEYIIRGRRIPTDWKAGFPEDED